MIYFITIFVATLFSSSLFSQTNCQEARQKYWMLYPDVANAKFDPYQHYQIHGKNEGRVWPACKGEEKDCENAKSQYYKLYPDVFNAGANAWTHYKTYGFKEGRVWPLCINDFIDRFRIKSPTTNKMITVYETDKYSVEWFEAVQICKKFGKSCRLPTIKELKFLFKESLKRNILNTAGSFWSSTSDPDNSDCDRALYYDFGHPREMSICKDGFADVIIVCDE